MKLLKALGMGALAVLCFGAIFGLFALGDYFFGGRIGAPIAGFSIIFIIVSVCFYAEEE